MSDYHLHLHPHVPFPGTPPMGTYPPGWIDRFVEAAQARGVTEVGFTEHLYRCVESIPAFGRWWELDPDRRLGAEMAEWIGEQRTLSLERYVEVVLDAKQRGLPVKLGLEVDFVPGTEARVIELLAPYPFDYLVGSIHWIGAWNFMRSSAPEEFARRGADVAFAQYFALETDLAASGLVDVLAHADVIKRHRIRPEGSLEHLYRPLVEAAVSSGTAVEVSSAGLRHDVGEIFPAPDLLALFAQAQVPITLASDAHVPDEAGWGHDEVIAAALAAGYAERLAFDARRRVSVPLGASRADPPRPSRS